MPAYTNPSIINKIIYPVEQIREKTTGDWNSIMPTTIVGLLFVVYAGGGLDNIPCDTPLQMMMAARELCLVKITSARRPLLLIC